MDRHSPSESASGAEKPGFGGSAFVAASAASIAVAVKFVLQFALQVLQTGAESVSTRFLPVLAIYNS